jgi:HK97 family phage major capsid protein
MAAAVVAGVTNVQTLGSAGVFTYADLRAIWSSIDAAYRAQAVWILSTAAMVQLRTLKDTAGRPLLVDAPHVQDTDNQGNVQSAALLLGCKVLESNNGFANNMTSGSIVGFFGAVGKVIPVRYAGAEIITAPERFADYGQMSWTGFSRLNASTVALASAGVLIQAH